MGLGAIGAAIGILVGCFFVWLLDRRHQKTIKKLVESRKKIERQRTQAVNDLFAYRSGERPESRVSEQRPPSAIPNDGELVKENTRLQTELTDLRTLIARADAALTTARRKRDDQEAQIARLKAMIDPSSAQIIDLRPPSVVADRTDRAATAAQERAGGVAL